MKTFEQHWQESKSRAVNNHSNESWETLSFGYTAILDEAASLLAQSIREEYEPYRCKCFGNLNACANERCWDLKECQDVYIRSTEKGQEIERLHDEIKNLKYRIDRLINLKNQTE